MKSISGRPRAAHTWQPRMSVESPGESHFQKTGALSMTICSSYLLLVFKAQPEASAPVIRAVIADSDHAINIAPKRWGEHFTELHLSSRGNSINAYTTTPL